MKIRSILVFTIVALMLVSVYASAAPAMIALSNQTSVTIKFVDKNAYTGGSVSFEILHWPDKAGFASGKVDASDIKVDALGNPAFTIDKLSPKLWSPQTPELYTISIKDSTGKEIGSTRFGFRTFEVKDRKFYLNGKPIFLRSIPINPPGRELPAETGQDPVFAREYLKLVKSANVNLVRVGVNSMGSPAVQTWLDVCDEIGLLTDEGNYGSAPGGNKRKYPTPEQSSAFYHNMVAELASHPSVVIYILTNEVNPAFYNDFLEAVRADLRLLDPTRLVIGNTGYGKGQGGEIFDYHKYKGWYYNNISDWYGEYRDWLAMADAAGKPFTVSECCGVYTADSGYFQSLSKQLAPMVRWVGTADDPRLAALEYQATVVKDIVEIGRRVRTEKTGVTSIMPFTYFFGWTQAKTADDLFVKPAFTALKDAFQPILISPECLSKNVYAGNSLKMKLFVINDDDYYRNVISAVAKLDVVDKNGKVVASKSTDFASVPYYSNVAKDFSIAIPANLPKGYYTVNCSLTQEGEEISRNSFEITVAPKSWTKTNAKVYLYDPMGTTTASLSRLGIKTTKLSSLKSLPKSGVLVIGEEAFVKGGYPAKSAVSAFLSNGGRILCLRQKLGAWKSDWLPANFNLSKSDTFSYVQQIGGNQEIFKGLTTKDFRYWNELGRAANQTPDVCPVITPLRPANPVDLKSARIWAATDHMLRRAVVVEIFQGKGSIVLNQFKCTERTGSDPVAAKVLADLVDYSASANHPGLLDLSKPIKWDLSALKSGAYSSTTQGFYGHSPTFNYRDGVKGRLGADHRVDGFTLVGIYGFTFNGCIDPIPNLYGEGWGYVFGKLSKPATTFMLKLHNPTQKPGTIKLNIDGKDVGDPVTVAPGQERVVQWQVSKKPGPTAVKMIGTRCLVITESAFK